eukprot:gene54257-37217_t
MAMLDRSLEDIIAEKGFDKNEKTPGGGGGQKQQPQKKKSGKGGGRQQG